MIDRSQIQDVINGVRIENRSESDPLVILKHYGPGNPEAPRR